MPISGIVPVNKPEGLRSTDCVQKLRHIFGRKTKIGHGGTLDSTASGLLLVLVGQATRLSNFVMDLPKRYEAEIEFGSATTTDDASGEVTDRAPWEHIDDALIDGALCSFMGWRMQSPPVVSAVHIDGERAHTLARSGRAVVPDPKPVCFLNITRLSKIDDTGIVRFCIYCRKGTYIRSFARDLGVRLGTFAHVKSLKRVSSGPFSADNARNADELFSMSRDMLESEMIPLSNVAELFAGYEADEEAFENLRCGRKVTLDTLKRRPTAGKIFFSRRLIVSSGKNFSLCAPEACGGTWALVPEVNIIFRGEDE